MDLALSVMKWPLVACLLLPGLLVYLGLHIVRRGIIFVDLALAQVAALGTCMCVVLGAHSHYWGVPVNLPFGLGVFHVDITDNFLWSVGFTLAGAAVFSMTRGMARGRVPQEALIGIVYVVAAALAVLLLSRSSEGNEELKKTLIGDVLVVQPEQVVKTAALFFVVGIAHYLFRRPFLAISFDHDGPEARSLRMRAWDFLFYALFGLLVTTFVQIGGVLLTFSYLIVPAVCGNLLATSLRAMLAAGWVVATLGGVSGLWASYQFDLPTGAAIVCCLGAMLVVTALAAAILKRCRPVPTT